MIVLITRGERTYDVGCVGKGLHFSRQRSRENVRNLTGNGDQCIVLLDGGYSYPEALAQHKNMCETFGFKLKAPASAIPMVKAEDIQAGKVPNGIYTLASVNYWLQPGDTIVEYGPTLCNFISVLEPVTWTTSCTYRDILSVNEKAVLRRKPIVAEITRGQPEPGVILAPISSESLTIPQSKFKSFEVTPLCDAGDGLEACNPVDADLWGVYGRDANNLAVNIIDCPTRSMANQLCRALNSSLVPVQAPEKAAQPQWTTADSAAASAMGWDLFNEDGEYGIEKIDKPTDPKTVVFNSDKDAMQSVMDRYLTDDCPVCAKALTLAVFTGRDLNINANYETIKQLWLKSPRNTKQLLRLLRTGLHWMDKTGYTPNVFITVRAACAVYVSLLDELQS